MIKTGTKIFLLCLTLCSICIAQDTPKLGWKRLGSESFALNATESKYFALPRGNLRLEFQAEEAIYTGVLTAQQKAALDGKYLTLEHFRQFHCVKTSILQASSDCRINANNAFLAIRDKRGPITKLAGAYSTAKPTGASAGLSDRASKPNKVAVTVYLWACIDNCPK